MNSYTRRTALMLFILLGRFLHSAVGLEVGHELLHSWQRIGKGSVAEPGYGVLYPLEEVGDHLIVLLLHALNVHKDANDLKNIKYFLYYSGVGKTVIGIRPCLASFPRSLQPSAWRSSDSR